MKLKQYFACTASAAALLFTGAANATVYAFDLAGFGGGQWQIDTAVAPVDFFPGAVFSYSQVAIQNSISQTADFSFWNTSGGGGLGIFYNTPGGGHFALLTLLGAQLYTGPESAPEFVSGIYSLRTEGGAGGFTLTISTPVPEPETYGMLLAGLGLAGAIARRRRI